MLALLAYCWWSTGNADFPEDAQTKWDWVWKALLFAIFLPFTPHHPRTDRRAGLDAGACDKRPS